MSNILEWERVYVAGHTGMVGQALIRVLHKECGNPGSVVNLITPRAKFDLRDQVYTDEFFRDTKPTVVLFAAARVGGIGANSSDLGGFLYDNLMIAANAINSAMLCGTVKRFVFLGSSCIYPKHTPQPIPETALMSGPLEETNEGYALAKIVGAKLCQYYRHSGGMLAYTLMPCNLYGPGDNYHPSHSHVLASMIHRFHTAKQNDEVSVTIWGSGTPLREFMHVDDLAEAVLHSTTLENPPDLMNVGSGEEVSIIDLAKTVAEIVGYTGDIITDTSKPDGVKQKLIDSSRIIATGWSPKIKLIDGIRQAYGSYLDELEKGSLRSK